jgi:uncharacterized protein
MGLTATMASAFDPPLRWAAVGSIRAYQRWVSPYKGFRCAHHALHGEGSCSHFGLAAFRSNRFGTAWGLLLARFHACREALATLSQMANDGGADAPKRRRSPGGSAPTACDFADCACAADLIPSGVADCLPSGGCAFDACEIGSCF